MAIAKFFIRLTVKFQTESRGISGTAPLWNSRDSLISETREDMRFRDNDAGDAECADPGQFEGRTIIGVKDDTKESHFRVG